MFGKFSFAHHFAYKPNMVVTESCFSSVGKGNLARVDGLVDGAKYRVTPKEDVSLELLN